MKKCKIAVVAMVSVMLAGCGGGGGGGGVSASTPVTPLTGGTVSETISDNAVRNGTGSNPAQRIGSVVQSNNRDGTTGTTTDTIVASVAANGRVTRVSKTAAAGAAVASWDTSNPSFSSAVSTVPGNAGNLNRQMVTKRLSDSQELAVLTYSKYENANDWLAGGFWVVADPSQNYAVAEYGAFVDGNEYTNALPTSGGASYLGDFAAYYTPAQGASVPASEYTGRARLTVNFAASNGHTMSGTFDNLYNQLAGAGVAGISFTMGNVAWNNTNNVFIGRDVITANCTGAFSACSDGGDNTAAQFFGNATSGEPHILGGTFGITDLRITETINEAPINHRGNVIGVFGGFRQ